MNLVGRVTAYILKRSLQRLPCCPVAAEVFQTELRRLFRVEHYVEYDYEVPGWRFIILCIFGAVGNVGLILFCE